MLKQSLILISLLSAFNGRVVLAEDAERADELKPGQIIGRHIFGLATDTSQDPLMINDDPLIYDKVSFQEQLSVGENTFIVSGFNHDLGGLYMTRFAAETKQYIDTVSMDLPSVEGISRPSGSMVSPWQSVLFSESQAADAANPAEFIEAFKPFYKDKAEMVKPYNYGWVSEVVLLDDSGESKIIKNYAIGRVSASSLYLMPDGRSLYLHDATNSQMLYLFVSEEPNNFAKGSLYGIVLDADKPTLVELGSESVLRMKFSLRRMEFDDLFEISNIDQLTESNDVVNKSCETGFTFIATHYGDECLKIKKRNEKYAGLYEPVRTLAVKRNGAPLNKISAVRFDSDRRVVEVDIEGVTKTYQLEQDDQIGSAYLIK